MLIPTILWKKATMLIIAPHGITDWVHAEKHDAIPRLMQTYAYTTTAAEMARYLHQDWAVNLAFIAVSIAHFRHDMPKIGVVPRYVWSAATLAFCIFGSPDAFLAYMVLIHVPNHYRIQWKYLKGDLVKSAALVFIATALFVLGEQTFDLATQSSSFQEPILSIAKSMIMGHILYEECGAE
jgi:hypothetical protein